MTMKFYKMTGGGNDFVVFDNRAKTITLPYDQLAQKVCNRHFGVGADGLLVLENTPEADFRMVYYNADGSRASMCGNGARCIARFAYILGAAKEQMRFLTDAGILSAEIKPESVKLKMSDPSDLKLDNSLGIEGGQNLNVSSVNTGVPHAVVLVNHIEKVDVQNWGRQLRYHAHFSPAGTNVNFVEFKDGHNLQVRTYERGVEGETFACGTGIVASSLVAAFKGLVESPVSCRTQGGQVMQVYFNLQGDTFSDVYLEGPAVVCFRGELA